MTFVIYEYHLLCRLKLLTLAASSESEKATMTTIMTSKSNLQQVINQSKNINYHMRKLQTSLLYNASHRIYDIFISIIPRVLYFTSIFTSNQIMTLLIVLFAFELNKFTNHFIIPKIKSLENSSVFIPISAVSFQYQRVSQFIFLHSLMN